MKLGVGGRMIKFHYEIKDGKTIRVIERMEIDEVSIVGYNPQKGESMKNFLARAFNGFVALPDPLKVGITAVVLWLLATL